MKVRSKGSRRLATLAKEAREEKSRSVDSFFRSVYDSLSVRVLAEAAANVPPARDEDLAEIEAGIEAASGPRIAVAPAPEEKKRARR